MLGAKHVSHPIFKNRAKPPFHYCYCRYSQEKNPSSDGVDHEVGGHSGTGGTSSGCSDADGGDGGGGGESSCTGGAEGDSVGADSAAATGTDNTDSADGGSNGTSNWSALNNHESRGCGPS